MQAHYEARAANLEGVTAHDLYMAEAPDIAEGRGGRIGIAGKTVLDEGRATISLFGRADASTFIHETGHTWLEELDRDAKDDRATQSVRDDAATVRNWLNAEPDAPITTRQHEKFARGFERYMMEGHAPSQALAGVFAKFKAWLTTIYETVAKLRAPITDDIRRVFDRMLTTGEEPTVIAPEREVPHDLATQHEALVETTPPDRAAPVADDQMPLMAPV